MIKITCSNCGKHLEAPDETAGKKGKCPGCGSVFNIPEIVPLQESQTDQNEEPSYRENRTEAYSVVTHKTNLQGTKIIEETAENRNGTKRDKAITRSMVRPWIRYWARLMDYVLFGFLCGIILLFIYPPLLDMNEIGLNSMLMFLFVFVESAMLSSWGTTPGKGILNIRIREFDGSKLSFNSAVQRSAQVWLRGLGLGIPIVSFVTQIIAYKGLTREGITSWDKEGNFCVRHGKIGFVRTFIAVIIFVLFAAFAFFVAMLSL